MVFVGKISYSLYLWHWPLLAFAHYLLGKQLTPQVLAVVALLTVLFSIASYYFIEQPLRHRQWSFSRTGLVYYVLPCLVVGALYMQGRSIPKEMFPYVYRGSVNVSEKELAYKTVGDSLADNHTLIVGNSHTMQLHDFFDKVAKHEGWRATFSGVSAHFPQLYAGVPNMSAKEYEQMLSFVGEKGDFKKELDALRTYRLAGELDKYSTVIISLNWWHPDFITMALPSVENVIAHCLQEGKKVILVNSCYTYNTYRVAETYHKVMGKGNLLAQILPEPILRNEEYAKAERDFAEVKQEIDSSFPQVRWINLLPMLPADLMVDGKSVLCNGTHINIFGANYLADQFIKSGQRLLLPQDVAKMKSDHLQDEQRSCVNPNF